MLGLAVILLSAGLVISGANADWQSAQTIYEFSAKDIHGQDVSLEKYRGHVLIVVNVASECGLTPKNYKQLVQLHEKYADSSGLRILAFPSNQFAQKEPGTSEQILEFIKKFNVQFDMFEKIDVNGDSAHPLYKWLNSKIADPSTGEIKWNFVKFIIDKEGQPVERYAPTTDPRSMEDDLKKYF